MQRRIEGAAAKAERGSAMISDTVLGMFELSNDLLYGRIPVNKYRYYVDESLILGREAAKKMKGIGDILQLYEESGIKIAYQEVSGEKYGISFRAQSEYGTDGSAGVLVYRQSITDLARHSTACGSEFGIDDDRALQVHLAHEYFHYLEHHSAEVRDGRTMEYYNHGFVSGYLEQVSLMKFFGWKRSAGILRCSEIAAHAFAKELTGLEVLPNYYDYTYLIAKGKLKREDFFERANYFGKLN